MAEITLKQRYVLQKQLGGGGEGTVYQATASDGTAVAVKELHGLYSDPEQHHLESQLRVLASLEGIPGIPHIQERGFIGGRYYIVSQFIEGESLEQMVASGRRFGIQEAKQFMNNMLETVQNCHEHGIIIRDIKPDNIKMNGRPWIVDINSLGDAYAESQTVGVGTLGYVAPEQRDNEAVFASDIYSLGKTVYRAMTGRKVSGSRELSDEDFAVMGKIDSGLAGIIQKMCQPELSQRYQSAVEVLHDLDIGHVTEPLAVVATAVAKQKTKAPRLSWLDALWIASSPSDGPIKIGEYKIVHPLGNGYVIIDKKRNILFGTADRPLSADEARNSHWIQDGEEGFIMTFLEGHWRGLRRDGSFSGTTIKGFDYIPLSDNPIVWNRKVYAKYKVGGSIAAKYLTEDGENMPAFLGKATIIHGQQGDYAVVKESDTLVKIVDEDLRPVFGGTQNKFLQYSSKGGLEVMIFDTATQDGTYSPIVVDIDGNDLYKVSSPDFRRDYVVDLSYTEPTAASDGRVFRQLDAPYHYMVPQHIIADQYGTIVWEGSSRVTNMQITNPNTLRIQLERESFTDVDISPQDVRIRNLPPPVPSDTRNL